MKCTATAAAIIALSGATFATPNPSGLLDDIKDTCDPYDPYCQPAGPFLNHLVDSSKAFTKLTEQDGLTNDNPTASAKYQLPVYSPQDYEEDDMYDELPYQGANPSFKYPEAPGKGIDEEDYNDLYDNEYDDTYDRELAEKIPSKTPFEAEPKKLYPRSVTNDTDFYSESVDVDTDDTGSFNATMTSFDIVNTTDTSPTGVQQVSKAVCLLY